MPLNVNGNSITSLVALDIVERSIVQSNLVMYVDAGLNSSYNGSGATWTDLTGSGINGTIYNGTAYSTTGGGSFAFDGSDDYVYFNNNTNLNTNTPSVEVWVRTNATSQSGFWFEKGTVNTQYSLFQEGGSIVWRQNYGGYTDLRVTTSAYMGTTTWYHVVGTYTSGTRRIFINGSIVGSDAQTGNISTNSGGQNIGSYISGGYFYNGNLAVCRVYTKALSQAEVIQNFNAERIRFGV